MSTQPIDMATIRQFLEAQGYEINIEDEDAEYTWVYVSKYDADNYQIKRTSAKLAYANALNHFLCDYMGRYWIRLSENLLMFKALAKLDDSQYEIFEGAIFYFKQLEAAILVGES